MIEIDSSRSSMKGGIGRISSRTTPMTPIASATSPFINHPSISRGLGRSDDESVESDIFGLRLYPFRGRGWGEGRSRSASTARTAAS